MLDEFHVLSFLEGQLQKLYSVIHFQLRFVCVC